MLAVREEEEGEEEGEEEACEGEEDTSDSGKTDPTPVPGLRGETTTNLEEEILTLIAGKAEISNLKGARMQATLAFEETYKISSTEKRRGDTSKRDRTTYIGGSKTPVTHTEPTREDTTRDTTTRRREEKK